MTQQQVQYALDTMKAHCDALCDQLETYENVIRSKDLEITTLKTASSKATYNVAGDDVRKIASAVVDKMVALDALTESDRDANIELLSNNSKVACSYLNMFLAQALDNNSLVQGQGIKTASSNSHSENFSFSKNIPQTFLDAQSKEDSEFLREYYKHK